MNGYRTIMWVAIGAIVLAAGVANILQDTNIIKFNDDILGALVTLIIGACIIVAATLRESERSSTRKS
jgi:hypothetical protein